MIVSVGQRNHFLSSKFDKTHLDKIKSSRELHKPTAMCKPQLQRAQGQIIVDARILLDVVNIVIERHLSDVSEKRKASDLETSWVRRFLRPPTKLISKLNKRGLNKSGSFVYKMTKVQDMKKRKAESQIESPYAGVNYDRRHQKFRAQISGTYLGLYKNDEDAAMVVNYHCDQLGLPRRNPGVGVKIPECKRVRKKKDKNMKKSNYRGVTWDPKKNMWEAQVTYEHTRFPNGHYDTELEAAKAVNQMCNKIGIKLRNPSVDS